MVTAADFCKGKKKGVSDPIMTPVKEEEKGIRAHPGCSKKIPGGKTRGSVAVSGGSLLREAAVKEGGKKRLTRCFHIP